MNTFIPKCFNTRIRLYQTRLIPKNASTTAEKLTSININKERISSLSLKESAKNFNDRLKRGDVLIYRAPQEANKFFWWWHIAAFLQFIFWANLAELSWKYQQKEKNARNSSINTSFLDKYKPAIYTASYLFAGFGIGAVMFTIPARSVLTMSILKNGNMAKITTGRKYQWGREKKIPIKKLYTNQLAWNEKGSGSNAIFLRSEDQRMAYMLEGSGKFDDPKIFDLLFYKNKKGK